MSRTWYIDGIVPPDDTWEKMRAAFNACTEAGVEPPKEVRSFFDGDDPNGAGRSIELPTREWHGEWRDGWEVDVADIPASVKIIRFSVG